MRHGGEPTNQQSLVEGYEALLSRTWLMLDSARAADWPALIDQESEYVMQVERVARLDAEHQLDTDEQERKAHLLEQILENDLEIRKRLLKRHDELGKLINTSQRQQNLRHTYGVIEQTPTTPTDLRHIQRAP